MRPPLLVVDAANVVGVVPDGWWRRRREATELLRAALEPVAAAGLAPDRVPAGLDWLAAPLEVVLVVEGAAARVAGTENVRVLAAPASGDDAIVQLVATEGAGRPTAVATADRALRARVRALGAAVVPPTMLPRRARLAAG